MQRQALPHLGARRHRLTEATFLRKIDTSFSKHHSVPMRCGRLAMVCSGLLALFLLLVTLPAASGQYAWHIQRVEGGVSGTTTTSIALDSTGRPHIAFADGHGALKYAVLEGTNWAVDHVDDEGWVTGTISMVLDERDLPHISYFDATRDSTKYAHLDGVAWRTLEVDRSRFEGYNSIALDPDGGVAVAYVGYGGVLRLARLQGISWSIEDVDDEVVTARYPSLAFGLDGYPQIAYYGNGNLLLSRWLAYYWSKETVDQDVSPHFITMRIDPGGVQKMGYQDSRLRDLKYAQWNGSGWAVESIEGEGEVGWDASLALDPLGHPQISYYDRTLGILKHASKQGDGWAISIVDNDGVVGLWSSMAVGSDGRPHFSYFSYTRREIEYAYGDTGIGIRTWPAKALGPTSAILVGEVTSLGGFPEAHISFEWRPAGGNWSSLEAGMVSQPGFREVELLGLHEITTYEFRVITSLDGVTVVGNTQTFTTPATPRPEPILPDWAILAVIVGAIVGGLVIYNFTASRGNVNEEEGSPSPPGPRTERGGRSAGRRR